MTKLPIIVFVDSVRLQVAINDTTIKSMEMSTALVRDSRIINKSQFSADLENFFTTQRIPIGPVLFVLAESICFSHRIKPEETTEKEQLSRNFYDMVPAETVIKREYEIGREIVLVAADSEFVVSIVQSFVQIGCTVSVVIPHIVLPQIGTKRWLDAEYVGYLLKNSGELVPWSMPMPEMSSIDTFEKVPIHSKKSKPPYMLIGIFIFLVLVLVAMLVFVR